MTSYSSSSWVKLFMTIVSTRAANSNSNSKELDHFAKLKLEKIFFWTRTWTRIKLFEFIKKILKLLKRNKRSLRNIVCCSSSHNPCKLKLWFYKRKAAYCLFVHAIATYEVQGCEFELGHFCRTRTWTRKIKFIELELELGLATIPWTWLKIDRVCSPGFYSYHGLACAADPNGGKQGDCPPNRQWRQTVLSAVWKALKTEV